MSTPGSTRMFVGLQPPLDIARRLHAQARQALGECQDGGVRLCAAGDLHVTLCFLGQVTEEHRAAFAPALARELQPLHGPSLRFSGTGAFPARGRERVLWAAIEELREGCGALESLKRASEQAARSIGIELRDDQRALRNPSWTPHCTLARVDGSRAARIPAGFYCLATEGAFDPVEVLVFASRGSSGATGRYEVQCRVPLRSGGR